MPVDSLTSIWAGDIKTIGRYEEYGTASERYTFQWTSNVPSAIGDDRIFSWFYLLQLIIIYSSFPNWGKPIAVSCPHWVITGITGHNERHPFPEHFHLIFIDFLWIIGLACTYSHTFEFYMDMHRIHLDIFENLPCRCVDELESQLSKHGSLKKLYFYHHHLTTVRSPFLLLWVSRPQA